jgi:hypothetical protein
MHPENHMDVHPPQHMRHALAHVSRDDALNVVVHEKSSNARVMLTLPA